MIDIKNFLSSPARQSQTIGPGDIKDPISPDHTLRAANFGSAVEAESQISSFSKALSDAAARAAERDANSSRQELAEIAHATFEKLCGDSYQKNKAANDIELPGSDDPQRLAQARQATNFSNGKGNNPFEGMPSDQLTLIIYDESGSFTVNERRAARHESYLQDLAWRTALCEKIRNEYDHTRKVSSESYREVLDHYKSLPPIEEAQISEGYDVQLQNLIDQNGPDLFQNGEKLESVFDLIMKRLNDRTEKHMALLKQPASSHAGNGGEE